MFDDLSVCTKLQNIIKLVRQDNLYIENNIHENENESEEVKKYEFISYLIML